MLQPLDNGLVVSRTLCKGHPDTLYNGFNPSAIVPDSHDLQACRRDTLIALAWLLVEVIVVRIVAALIYAWGYQRAFKPSSRH